MEYLSIKRSGKDMELTSVQEENHQVNNDFRCLFVFTTVKTQKEKHRPILKKSRRESFISAFYWCLLLFCYANHEYV